MADGQRLSAFLESEQGARLPRPLLLRVMKCARPGEARNRRNGSGGEVEESARRHNQPEMVAAVAPAFDRDRDNHASVGAASAYGSDTERHSRRSEAESDAEEDEVDEVFDE